MKDHYLESLVWESIVQSLKGSAADMARYMGPTTSVAHILQRLMIIFSTVASFNVLVQNFYKVMQINHEKVPSFATQLEGTLNQIRLQCPGRITYWEMQQHLKDHLLHWVCKHIRDSIKYIYSNPGTTYSQFMITACKAESENKDTCDKVRVRSAMTTEPVEGTTELGIQITKLMAALTRAGQCNSPTSGPNSPRQRCCGRGWTDRNTSGHPSSHNGQTGLGQTASTHSTSVGHGTGTTSQGQGQSAQGAPLIWRTPLPSSASDAKVGATWLGNEPPQQRP